MDEYHMNKFGCMPNHWEESEEEEIDE